MHGSIEVKGLSKSYGRNKVLRKIDLSVQPGQCLGIVGSNGSGKTTIIRIIATLSTPLKGTVKISGFDMKTDALEVRARLGLISHHPLLYEELSAMENLLFFSNLYDIPTPKAIKRSRKLLKKVGLRIRENDRVGTFSRGMAQRLALAKAFLTRPDVLLLDEPFSSLDPQGMRVLNKMVEEHLEAGGCVMVTSHILDRVIEMAGSIQLLSKGSLGEILPSNDNTKTTLERFFSKGGGP